VSAQGMKLLSADGDDAVGNSPGSWRVEGTLPEEVGEGDCCDVDTIWQCLMHRPCTVFACTPTLH